MFVLLLSVRLFLIGVSSVHREQNGGHCHCAVGSGVSSVVGQKEERDDNTVLNTH